MPRRARAKRRKLAASPPSLGAKIVTEDMADASLASLPVADAAAAEENGSVNDQWCQLRDTVQSTALAVLGRARRQHQERLDDNDVTISNLLVNKNRLHKAYVDRPTDAYRAAFYRSRRLVRQRLREMKDT
nr:unnamed protein product [Spirometra erinaceieuropaei]